MTTAVCVDVGSTYTKAAKIDLNGAELIRRAEVPTTASSDVLAGLDAAVAAVGGGDRLYVCSSAGGGLRLAVIGYEQLVTAEAGHRVGLSAGAQVVHVAAGPMTGPDLTRLRATRPDVLLLAGGTDGGDAETLLHNARRLAAARLRIPVVLAGNLEVRDEAHTILTGRGVPVTATANVLPRIGVLDPLPARAAIRDVFLRHVIGGKRLSKGRRFARLVRAATPDAVLAGVEALADLTGYGILVVDVGGATTDVYSALVPDAEAETGPRRDVAGTLWRARTVEGDLGVAVGADGTRTAAVAEKLSVPDGDRQLAATAAVIALRRHARGRPGLRDVRLVIGSGGVLRHGGGDEVLQAVLADVGGGWAPPERARSLVDEQYILAAAGLLAAEHPDVAARLLGNSIR
ncbi:methylaspartate mutase accessory protein GlmL [Actinoplanes sichuanensis]|uniref:Glutamate mutase L n=1 Tax=Actinoplanes sichuanensis TaxID=512349 RepID=A0ABW4A6K0_9ACTN|nr:glutamate mutase L [Actinoplanes sichuanensis]BEL02837.1 methylaspartate mutase accessory protein GlmL [Actinoplanes sichuanensis]